jgi:flagellar export protein FliJ
MPKFLYKYETIKNVKKNQEKIIQKEVAALNTEIRRLDDEFKKIEESESERRKKLKLSCMKAFELRFEKNYEFLISKKLQFIQSEIEKLEKQKENKISELLQKSIEHKILNTLEENHFMEFRKEEEKTESKQINEFAIQKYNRQNR